MTARLPVTVSSVQLDVVLHVGLCEEIFARKHTATHKPTSAQPLSAPHSDQRDIHTSNKFRRGKNLFQNIRQRREYGKFK